MATTKIEIKFDLKSEATKTLYAGAGVADLAVAAVRDAVFDAQKRIQGVQKDVSGRVEDVQKTVASLTPKSIADRAVTRVNTRVGSAADDAKARRAAVEARVAELQSEAKELPTKATKTYADLAKRGEIVVKRIRNQEDVKEAVADAKTTVAKAKTTRTQTTKAADTAKTTTKQAVALPIESPKRTAMTELNWLRLALFIRKATP